MKRALQIERLARRETARCRAVRGCRRRIVVPRDFGSSRLWRTPHVAAAIGRSASVPVLIVPPVRHRLGELFFGSTFRHVVRRSLRPILAVPVAAGAYRWVAEPSAHVIDEAHLRAA